MIAALDNYENHKRSELVSFDDIDYTDYSLVAKARKAWVREQFIRQYELKYTHDALSKCKDYHEDDAQRNCYPLVMKYMKMLDDYQAKGYLGYQRNDPSK